MAKSCRFGYARKLTKDDDLEEQKRRLMEAGCEERNICVDGNVDTRNGLNLLKGQLVREGDEVVVCSLEKLNRRPEFLEKSIYDDFLAHGVSVVSLDDTWFTTKGEEGKVLEKFIKNFCSYLKRAGHARNQYRMEKKSSKKGRGPTPKVSEEEAMQLAERIERNLLSKDEVAEQYGISIPTVNRICRRYRDKYQMPL